MDISNCSLLSWSQAAVVPLSLAIWTSAYAASSEFRGQVLDQDSRKPIPDAIVAAKYMGGPAGKSVATCNRIEVVRTDGAGWFSVPLDRFAGKPMFEVHHRDYIFGRPLKLAMESSQAPGKWQVYVMQPSADNETSTPIRAEPRIYNTRDAAVDASREEVDIYMKRFSGTNDERASELRRLSVQMHCEGYPKTTEGGVGLIDSVLAEAESRALSKSTVQRIQETKDLLLEHALSNPKRTSR